MREALKLVDDYVYSLIDARPTAKAEHRDLLGLYMSARDEQGQAMTRQELRDAVLNLVIAGRYAVFAFASMKALTREQGHDGASADVDILAPNLDQEAPRSDQGRGRPGPRRRRRHLRQLPLARLHGGRLQRGSSSPPQRVQGAFFPRHLVAPTNLDP